MHAFDPGSREPHSTLLASLPATRLRTFVFLAVALAGGLSMGQLLEGPAPRQWAGALRASSTSVTSDRSARIERFLVQPGDNVIPGQPIVQLDDAALSARIDEKRRELAHRQTELEQAAARSEVELSWRQKQLDSEIFDTELKSANYLKEQFALQITEVAWDDFLENYNNRINSAPAPIDPFESIVYATPIQPDENHIRIMLNREAAQNSAEVFAAQIRMCDKRRDELRRLKSDLNEQVRKANGVDVAESRLEQSREELKLLEEERRSLVIHATTYGKLGLFRKQPGEMVELGEMLVEVLDEEQRFVSVDVSTQFAHLYPEEETVELLFPDDVRLRGTVQAHPPQTSETDSEQAVTLTILPKGKLWPRLAIGTEIGVRAVRK